jgi:hypothetical protein
MGGEGVSWLNLPVQLTADDCMDTGDRVTHGAVTEANIKMG